MLTSLVRKTQLEKLDEFWLLKDRIYNLLIQGPLGLYADHVALRYVEQNIAEFALADFFLSERGLRKKHPGLFQCLEKARRGLKRSGGAVKTPVEISTHMRRFFVDEKWSSPSEGRFKQSKTAVAFELAGLRRLASLQMTSERN